MLIMKLRVKSQDYFVFFKISYNSYGVHPGARYQVENLYLVPQAIREFSRQAYVFINFPIQWFKKLW